MRKGTKIWLIIGSSFIVLGVLIFASVMTINRWDFTKLSTVKYETNTYPVSEEFNSISMKTDTADIFFLPSGDGTCQVICYEQEKIKYSVAVQDGTLTINALDERKWYDYIGIALGGPKITVYLPKTEYDMLFIKASTGDIEIPENLRFENIDILASTGDVQCYASVSGFIKIKLSTGDIRVENVSADALDLSVSTGDVTTSSIKCEGDIKIKVSSGDVRLTDIACKSFISTGSTGDISLKNVIATEQFSIKRSTGDVRFESCDAAAIFVETDTGDVSGSLLKDKTFVVESNTGRIDVPKTVSGGRCEINTATGDISITIK